MKLLLDTHFLVWWLNDSVALSEEARRALGDPENLAYASAVSIWEVVIKQALG